MAVIITEQSLPKIAKIVRFHRNAAGLSRIQLAEISGVGKTVIYDVENGKVTVRFETLLKILYTLNVSTQLDSPLMNRFEEIDDEKS